MDYYELKPETNYRYSCFVEQVKPTMNDPRLSLIGLTRCLESRFQTNLGYINSPKLPPNVTTWAKMTSEALNLYNMESLPDNILNERDSLIAQVFCY